jgi:hypothetical protein
MNSIINHLGEENPQKNKLIYEDYTFSVTFSRGGSWSNKKSVRRSAVYAELLSATCTNTLTIGDTNIYNDYIYLSGFDDSSNTYPVVGVQLGNFYSPTSYPNTLTITIRVYFTEKYYENTCVTYPYLGYNIYDKIPYNVGFLKDKDFIRI